MTDTATLVTDAAPTTEGTDTATSQTDGTLLAGSDDQPSSTATDEGASQTDDSAASASDDDQATGDEPQGAPDEYADFTLPEGIEIDPDGLGNLKALAKDLNLTQEQAQKVADLGAAQAQKFAEALRALGDRIEVLPDRILVYTSAGEATLEKIVAQGMSPITSLIRRSSLEDVFLRLTGRTLVE